MHAPRRQLRRPQAPRCFLALLALLLLTGCGGKGGARPSTSGVKPAQRLDPSTQRRAPADGNAAPAQASLAAGVIDEEDPDTAPEPSPEGWREMRDEVPVEAVAPMVHVLKRGQTLYSVAKRYGVDLDELVRVNGIGDRNNVKAGSRLTIPGTERAGPTQHAGPTPRAGDAERGSETELGGDSQGADDSQVEGTGKQAKGKAGSAKKAPKTATVKGPRMLWPLRGLVTARFGRRGQSGHHTGLDIDGERGDPIMAAASGTVIRAGSDGRYGQVVILDHGKG